MKIQNMFQKDINRDINGVVKVSQDDEKSLKQELSEYIITKELRQHFTTFFDGYEKTISQPTDKIGVWISGFFGSGKSHFLKILSYLLSNQTVDGKEVFEYFADKFDDPMIYAAITRCVSVPTESILFNIDIEGPLNKDRTAVLRVFAKMFYNHCGFYGEDLKIAKLERFIEKQGKTDDFHRIFREIHGEEWTEARNSAAFFEEDIVVALQSAVGMSETAARNWFNGEEKDELSIKQLVADIKNYVDGKGKNFRLLFMIDEVGQYIGDDGDLMLNLQSLVEEIGDKCRGKVWVMVTSQEAIDSIVKITGNDFSKIQGRFNTRLSLSSSSVDEVIKKRVLAKKGEADQLLQMVYDKEHTVLKNLFTFNNPIKDIKGFSGADEFSSTFPFVPYQFTVIQNVLAEIRKHGNSGKHLSGGERSMLSGFQEAAQKVQDNDENCLMPFYRFYDTVHTFLEGAIRRVIDRCQTAADQGDGIEQQDVNVLKLLYLVRYIDDIKANIDNIAVLLIDDIRTDKISLRASVAESLDRLLSQNYISRSGDTYTFLTDEEQDIAVDIKNTPVDSAQIVQCIAKTVFGEIYPSKKFRYGRYDFAYDQYIDEMLSGSATGGMRLRLITVANDYYGDDDSRFIMNSQVNNEAIVILSNETPYFEELEQAMKIRKYVKQRNVSQLPESIQHIIRERNDEARRLESRAQEYIEKSVENAKFYVHGETPEIKYGTAKDKLDTAMSSLVESVYSKLNMVNDFVESDADILQILSMDSHDAVFAGTGANNEDALNEIGQWLELQSKTNLATSMGDVQRRYGAIPYGWREIDIAALVARLIVQQKIQIKYGGAVIGKDERRLVDFLRKKSEIDKAVVTRRIAPPEELMRKSIDFLREYLNVMDIPADEDGLVRFVVSTLESKLVHYQDLINGEYSRERYPEKEVVTAARDLMSEIVSQKKDNVALLTRLTQKQDNLLDSVEDMENVEIFFKSQRAIFDSARHLQSDLEDEKDYFVGNSNALEAICEIGEILAMPKPYSRIKDLSELMQRVRQAKEELLTSKKEEVMDLIVQFRNDIHSLAGTEDKTSKLIAKADDWFSGKKTEASQSSSLIKLDAMVTQLRNYKDAVCREIAISRQPSPQPADKKTDTAAQPARIATVRRYDICPVKSLQSKEEVEQYVDAIRLKLLRALADSDEVQVN